MLVLLTYTTIRHQSHHIPESCLYSCVWKLFMTKETCYCVHTNAWLEMQPGQTITHLKGEMEYIYPFSLILQIIFPQSYAEICIYISNELLENHNTSNIFQR